MPARLHSIATLDDQWDGILEPTGPSLTASALSFNFDWVTKDPAKSRADEIRLLTVKNNEPPRNSDEKKPAGIGMPTGGQEENEDLENSTTREMRDESGYPAKQVIGRLFVVPRRHIDNEIHLRLVEAQDYPVKIREKDEVDCEWEPWSLTLRQIFEMPVAQDAEGNNRNPDGIYFGHRQRIFWAIEAMLLYKPDQPTRSFKELLDPAPIMKWLEPHREALQSAMLDLEEAGLLDEFLPDEDEYEE